MRKKRHIGLYGGTFDPVHFGHLNLAIEMYEKNNLDEVLFCPNFISPLKIDTPPIASAVHRLNMAKLAISDISYFSIYDEEIKRQGVSYTIDTLRALQKKYFDATISLIVAQDALSEFSKWKDYKEILKIAPLLIGTRGSFDLSEELKKDVNKNLILTRHLDISSTDIRDRLKKGLYCGHLVPLKVLDYIKHNSLYLYSK